ncbi:DDB1- and CUL4-associated factor 12 [Lunasporangiospora selenospora]|uniref:DDB1- and CUL4-associated factor 12 n=1 Tax=Lunasporangiospora selenospora TaxID=979761 RepID=A0A9P6FQL1_9FUNG|nr:DDB1- and CUL4-associated factor 12 [Lunasporangiospora selenospora]
MPTHTDCRPFSSYNASASSETSPATDIMGQLRRREYSSRQQLHLQLHRRCRQPQRKSSTRHRTHPRQSHHIPSADSSAMSLSVRSGSSLQGNESDDGVTGDTGSRKRAAVQASQPMTTSYSFPGTHPVSTARSLGAGASPGMDWITSVVSAASTRDPSGQTRPRIVWERASREIVSLSPMSAPASSDAPATEKHQESQTSAPPPSSTAASVSYCKTQMNAGQVMGHGGVASSTGGGGGAGAEARGGHVGSINVGRRMSTPVLSTRCNSIISNGPSVMSTITTEANQSPCDIGTISQSLNEDGSYLQRGYGAPFGPSPPADSDTDSDMMSDKESDDSEDSESSDSEAEYRFRRNGRTLHRSSFIKMRNKEKASLHCYFDHSSGRKNHTMELVMSRVPMVLKEHEYTFAGYDKIFASAWLNEDEVLVGTKCDQMAILNVRTNRRIVVPKLQEALLEPSDLVLEKLYKAACSQNHSLPVIKKRKALEAAQRDLQNAQMSTRFPGSYVTDPNSTSRSSTGFSIHDQGGNGSLGITFSLASSLERGLRFFSTGRRSSTPSFSSASQPIPSPVSVAPQTATTPAGPTGAAPPGGSMTFNQQSAINSLGVRSLSINPSKTLLAVGSGEPFQVTIYSLPELVPAGVLYGHADLVFSLKWVSDSVLVSGSRDGSFCVWKVSANGTGSRLASVGGSSVDSYGVPRVPDMIPATSKPVQVYFPELVRQEEKARVRDLAYNQRTGQLMTLAAEGYVKLWDRDTYTQISKLKMVHTAETVCLASNTDANLYAVGSQSHIMVVDPRVPVSSNGGAGGTVHVADSCDDGWGSREVVYDDETFYDVTVKNAVYSMAYSEAGTRIFAAGGPLQISISGSYAGLWC